jgi:hypothetical protein
LTAFSFSAAATHQQLYLLSLCVGDREARADGQRGELIDRIAAGAPVRKLLVIEALGYVRAPFAGDRLDHRAGDVGEDLAGSARPTCWVQERETAPTRRRLRLSAR